MRGTGYAITEIIWWLLIAALIGFVIGWVLRRWFLDRQGSAKLAELEAAEAERRQALQSELDEWKSKAASLSTDVDQGVADLDRMKTKLDEREQKIAAFEAKTSEHRSAVTKLEQKIEDREATIASLRADKGKEDSQVANLRKDLDAANGTIGALRRDADGYKNTIEALRGDLEGERRKQTVLEADLADCSAKLAAAESAAPVAAAPVVALPDKDVAVAKVAEIATRTRGTGPAVDDDLKLIHGVGPKLEQLLKTMDITSFRQVANFTTEDIQYVTAALDAFPGRIERDDWMSSAADEHQKKYGEPA